MRIRSTPTAYELVRGTFLFWTIFLMFLCPPCSGIILETLW